MDSIQLLQPPSHPALASDRLPKLALDIRNDVLQTLLDEANARAESTTTRISSTGNCRRQQAYFLTAARPPAIDPEGQWEARDGDIHEPDLRQRFIAAGYTVSGWESEDERLVWLPLPNGGRVPGHFDGEISGRRLPSTGIWEAKAMSAVRYYNLCKAGAEAAAVGGSGLERADPNYYFQVNLNMQARGRNYAVLAAKAKDGSQTRRMLLNLKL